MKTLLVGLGGTGCIVVSRVMKMISNDDPTIQFIGFDTDINQEEAEGLPIVQTSSSATVGQLLMSEQDWGEWFPNNRILKARNMKTGAGQIRVLSRLAFSDTLRREQGSPVELKRALDALFSHTQDTENERSRRPAQEEVKIMVVSSFAGGTGSGMFIQTSLFLRQYIRKHYHTDCRIRGLFALPDVFVGTEDIDRIQEESMYANAYASLKELNAINAICLSENPDVRGYNLSLPGLFTSRDINRIEDKSHDRPELTTANRKPFDCIFFVDNLNRNNNVLGSHEDYLDQMSQITYMQIYSAMESLTDSREDNFIMNHMQSDGEAMYCSAGAAKLVYPYEDVVKYCALRALKETISSKWIQIDKEFERRLNDAKERRKSDKSIPLPKLGDVYTDIIDHHLDSHDKGYAFIRDGVKEERNVKSADDGGKNQNRTVENVVTVDRAKDFFSIIDTYINDQYENDKVLAKGIKQIETILSGIKTFNETAAYKTAIMAQEKKLNVFLDTISERIPALEANICGDIFPLTKPEDPYALKCSIFNLLWISDKNGERHALHPLAARYLLYKLQHLIQELETKKKKDADDAWDAIEEYVNEDWDRRTKDKKEKPYEVVPKFRFDPKRLGFNKKYLSKYLGQVDNLKNYSLALLYARVAAKLLENIGTLVRHYEAMFGSMRGTLATLTANVEKLEERYRIDQPTESYLCASPYHMLSLYDEANLDFEDQTTEPKLYDPIAETVFDSAIEELGAKEKTKNMDTRTRNRFAEQLAGKMQHMFQTTVVNQFIETVKQNAPSLNLSAYQALERDCSHRLDIKKASQPKRVTPWTNKEIDKERRSLFDGVYDKAAPFLTYNSFHTPNPLNSNDDGMATWTEADFWGISEDNWSEINEATLGNAQDYLATTDTQHPAYVKSGRYSKYEICCYRAVYCIRLSEIPKFSEEDDDSGLFYEHYSNRIRKMLSGMYNHPDEGQTPHLDKHWHSAEYLPMISTYKQARDTSDAARAFWLGILFEGIRDQKNMQTGKEEACARFIKKSEDGSTSVEVEKERPLLYNGKPVSMARPFLVYKALQQDTLSVSKTIGTYEGELEKERDFSELGLMEPGSFSTASLSKTPLLKTMAEKTNPLTVMRAIIMDRQAGDEEKKTLVDELKRILDEYTAGLQSDTLKRKVLHIIFESSCFADPKKRAGAETAYSPYFDVIAAEYDEAKAKAAKKAALEAAKAKRAKSKTSKPAAPRKRKTT